MLMVGIKVTAVAVNFGMWIKIIMKHSYDFRVYLISWADETLESLHLSKRHSN